MKTIRYEDYLDKVYGCFVGKAISGNMGAPFEGMKMPMDLPFMPEMINPDMPNDDLDLQVLWLDVLEQKGHYFTSADLLARFVENCSYSPGEYAVMRKNFLRGIMPPYSGKFCNDYYIEGMGCPIRSEVWACVAVGNPELAAEFASRDGVQDHFGESVEAERFLAALECEAFFESDIRALIEKAINVLPKESKFRELVTFITEQCDCYHDSKTVLRHLLFQYGHPDCTNMYQNMGITLMSLLLGDADVIKTSMMALNCGFDTDCTCATAGAIIGLIRGGKALSNAFNLDHPTYALGVTSHRRSNLIKDLAEDIAKVGVQFTTSVNQGVCISDAPAFVSAFEPKKSVTLRVDYDGMPSIALGQQRRIAFTLCNHTNQLVNLDCRISTVNQILCDQPQFYCSVQAYGEMTVSAVFTLPEDTEIVYDRNVFTFSASSESGNLILEQKFGLAGATPWKLSGPYWRTEPRYDTADVLQQMKEHSSPYGNLMNRSQISGNGVDRIRHFHLNYAVDLNSVYQTQDELFERPDEDQTYLVHTPEDSFSMKDLFGFKGPCVAYLSRILMSEEERTVCVQIGHSAPFSLYLNGERIAYRDHCDNWTGENVHLENVLLKKGENRLALRMSRVNSDAKYNLTFSYGMTCAEHIVDLGSKNPNLW